MIPFDYQRIIATAVGWHIPDGCTNWRIRPDGKKVFFSLSDGNDPVPDYNEDLGAAASLCDFLAEQGWSCDLSQGTNKCWGCTFSRPERLNGSPGDLGKCLETHYHAADTIAEAICGAFLRTLNLWKE